MKKERIFWGIFFIAGALFLIVNAVGLLGDIGIWSILLTVILGACLIKSIFHKSVTGILFSIAFLCIVYAEPLGIQALTPWPVLGAALLGSIGISFLYRPERHYDYHHFITGTETVETADDAQIHFNTSFGGSIKYINSDDFQNAKLSCSFGSMKVYFDNAVIKNEEAIIYIDVSFGGMELYIPKTWNVVNQVSSAFGGLDEKNRNTSTGTPTVRLVGKMSFSGVEIVYI